MYKTRIWDILKLLISDFYNQGLAFHDFYHWNISIHHSQPITALLPQSDLYQVAGHHLPHLI